MEARQKKQGPMQNCKKPSRLESNRPACLYVSIHCVAVQYTRTLVQGLNGCKAHTLTYTINPLLEYTRNALLEMTLRQHQHVDVFVCPCPLDTLPGALSLTYPTPYLSTVPTVEKSYRLPHASRDMNKFASTFWTASSS